MHSNQLRGGSFLISDSPEVRRLLADQDARQYDSDRFWREKHTVEEGSERIRDMGKHPEQYPPGRTEFLKAMLAMPGFLIPGSPYCDVVERSRSKCGALPIETAVYVLIKITTGPSRGKEGWVCDNRAPGLFP